MIKSKVIKTVDDYLQFFSILAKKYEYPIELMLAKQPTSFPCLIFVDFHYIYGDRNFDVKTLTFSMDFCYLLDFKEFFN